MITFAILLDSYEPFEGKIINAEYMDANTIIISYIEGGEKHSLVFNTVTGEYVNR